MIVNHHLLLADLALKEEGFGELLPGADAVILDEAHQVPDTAANFFGVSVSTGQLLALAQDVLAESLKAQANAPLQASADALVKAVRDGRLLLPTASGRLEWSAKLEELERVLGTIRGHTRRSRARPRRDDRRSQGSRQLPASCDGPAGATREAGSR